MPRRSSISATLGAVAAMSLVCTLTFTPAVAQPMRVEPAPSTSSEVGDDTVSLLVAAVANTTDTRNSFDAFIELQQQPVFKDARLPSIFAGDAWYPSEPPRDYPTPRLNHIINETDHNVERWFVESPSMKRIVEVQIIRAPHPDQPAPMLYLLDGASAPSRSGWLREGHVNTTMAEEQVTLVMPVQASGTMYMDWEKPDPTIGHPQWETFLTQELPTVLEAPQQHLNFNGKRAIGGLSMGASGAIRLANAHPDVYHAAIGLSGCYSNSTPMGSWLTKAIAQSVGADEHNLWDDSTPEKRDRLDVVKNPEGLRNMPLYLFAADGVVTPNDVVNFRNRPREELAGGVLLEYAAVRCTHELDDSLQAHGIHHHKSVFQQGGVHAWNYYEQQLPLAWEYVKPALS